MPANRFRPEPRALAAAILVAVAFALGGGMAAAQDAKPERELQKLDSSLRDSETRRDQLRRRANRTAAEISGLKRRLVMAARRAQDFENRASDIERRLADLEAREATTSKSLAARRGQLSATLAALQRLARQPKLALVALPADPVDTVRGALLMRTMVPTLHARARNLGAELRDLATLRASISVDRERLMSNAEALAGERLRLAELVRDKRVLERVARRESWSEQARAAELAGRARTMRDLVHRLVTARGNLRRTDMAAAPGAPDRMASLGSTRKLTDRFVLPASGRVVHRFGAVAGDSAKAEGITIETRPAAHVVAPRRGTVVFAGPFRGYGRLLIIEHDEGYHVLLAGLDRIDAVVGNEVLAGEPVGAMTASSNRTPNLYLELRRSGQPINPLPWLAASKTKVSG